MIVICAVAPLAASLTRATALTGAAIAILSILIVLLSSGGERAPRAGGAAAPPTSAPLAQQLTGLDQMISGSRR